jgi:hypothetical protein
VVFVAAITSPPEKTCPPIFNPKGTQSVPALDSPMKIFDPSHAFPICDSLYSFNLKYVIKFIL